MHTKIHTLEGWLAHCERLHPHSIDLGLQRVREELLNGSGSNVASVALRWGFEHMGRFANQYRRAFGETPSQTLRRR